MTTIEPTELDVMFGVSVDDIKQLSARAYVSDNGQVWFPDDVGPAVMTSVARRLLGVDEVRYVGKQKITGYRVFEPEV